MKNIILLVFSFIIISCDTPFNTKTSDDDIFELNITHNIERVMPSAQVLLSWSEITVENFASIRIERMTDQDTAWTLAVELNNEFLTTYIDTITDDENLQYRIGMVDTDNAIIWTKESTNIPHTTSVIIPDEFATIQPAFNSNLMDDGDTILVKPGLYEETLGIAGKNILIKSTDGFVNTLLTKTVRADSIDQLRVVFISSGVLDGFTIFKGQPMHGSGGGVSMANNAIVKNCFIHDNHADSNENAGGGGVYITGNAKLYNNIISNNTCFENIARGVSAVSATGEIINNTIVNNEMRIKGPSSGLIIRNNVFYDSNPDLEFFDNGSKDGVIVDYSIFDTDIGFGSNNIISDPNFEDDLHYVPSANSPCIDAGHPDELYNDTDGTRNDVGAYGGPLNNK